MSGITSTFGITGSLQADGQVASGFADVYRRPSAFLGTIHRRKPKRSSWGQDQTEMSEHHLPSTRLLAGQTTDLGSARNRWVLWHITSGCNIECAYCYGSFEGGSYKSSYDSNNDLSDDSLVEAARLIAASHFSHVHINGGEPMLRASTLPTVLQALHDGNKDVWLLTNGLTRVNKLIDLVASGLIDTLAFSVDTVDAATGNRQRERTQTALKNVETIIAAARSHSHQRFGVYAVVTALTVESLAELVHWAASVGAHYINMQAVYLPQDHSAAHVVHPDQGYLDRRIHEALELAASIGLDTSGTALKTLTNLMLSSGSATQPYAENCFAMHGGFAYIAPDGAVLQCPAKPFGAEQPYANVTNMLPSDFAVPQERRTLCGHLSLDCLGMYEMAYMDPPTKTSYSKSSTGVHNRRPR